MENETIAIIILFGLPLILLLGAAVWWAWKDKDKFD